MGRQRRPSGAAALLALLGSSAAAQALHRGCPGATNVVSKEWSGPQTRVRLHSRLDASAANIYRVDETGQERLYGPVAPGATSEHEVAPLSVLRVRQQGSGLLLLERSIPSGEEIVDVEIEDCTDSRWLREHGHRSDPALDGCHLEALLSEAPVRGFHVLCAVGTAQAERLCIFADGLDQPSCTHSLPLQGGETVQEVTKSLTNQLNLKLRMPNAPGPALFSASGRRLPLAMKLEALGVPSRRRALVLVQGGEWHWPPIRVGFVRPLHGVVRTGIAGVQLRTLAMRPRVFEVKSFIELAECDRMLQKAGPHMKQSGVSVKDADRGKPDTDWRTSHNYFLPTDGDPVLEALDERIQNLTRIPIINSEYAQILRYDYWGRYTAHNDYFDPKDYKQDKGTLRLIGDGAYNRLLTVFMYMSDVDQGGETVFPSHGGRRPPADFGDCSQGLLVKPERQKVIIFYNQHPDGSLDPDSLHGGCRVLNGTKWSANYWVWNIARNYKSGPEHRAMAVKLLRWQEEEDREEEAAFAELAAASSRRAADEL